MTTDCQNDKLNEMATSPAKNKEYDKKKDSSVYLKWTFSVYLAKHSTFATFYFQMFAVSES